MPFSSSAVCKLALSAVSSRSVPDSVAPVTAGEIIFALRKKGKKKALVRGLVKIGFIRKKESVV